MRKQAIVTGFCLLSCLLPTGARAATPQFSGLYVFGDSLVDNGNFYAQTLIDAPSPPSPFPQDPNGASPGFPYYLGRFSNGPVWVELLPSELGIPSSSVFNFSSGGAASGTFHQAGSLFPGMVTQVNQYLTQAGNIADPTALYILSAGSNDYSDPSFSDPALIPLSVINNLFGELTNLTVAGAKNFLVSGVPDFSKIPINAGLPAQDLALLSALSNAHNMALETAIPLWSQSLNAKITFFDINELLVAAINNPAQYNLINVTDGCLLIASCIFNLTEQDQFLFWDSTHPTAAVHRYLTDFALSQLAVSTPEPSPILGFLGVLFLGLYVKFQR